MDGRSPRMVHCESSNIERGMGFAWRHSATASSREQRSAWRLDRRSVFIVCGEALFDFFLTSASGADVSLEGRAGGSPFNVAVGLARLRQPVAMLGGISNDALGGHLVRILLDEGVGIDAVVRCDAPTTIVLVDASRKNRPRYTFYGEGAADCSLQTINVPRVDDTVRCIHVGSYTTVVEPIAGAIQSLLEREHEARLIVYDANLRLGVEPSLDRWRRAFERISRLAHIIKVSDEERCVLFPGESATSFAERMLLSGAELVVVTSGGDGAAAWTTNASAHVDALQVDVVDTVGAGDSFHAGMLCRLAEIGKVDAETIPKLDKGQLCELLNFATRAAAITCQRHGADLPRRSEVNVLRPKIDPSDGGGFL
jgi:fructokinase